MKLQSKRWLRLVALMVKQIYDQAEAMRAYARQRNDADLELDICEIKLRATRRIGEISRELEKAPHGPGRGKKGKKSLPTGDKAFKAETLKAAGISTSLAHRCEQIASIPNEKFEGYITKKREAREPTTIKAALAAGSLRHRLDQAIDKSPTASPAATRSQG
jgi:hypothetical protein